METMLEQLKSERCWEEFYAYRTSLVCPKDFAKELRGFIDEKRWLPVCETIERGERFPLPKKAVISKMSSQKKRTVYIYPKAENTVLKMLTWLLLRRYDGVFSPALYSFRPGRTAKDAVRCLTRTRGIWQKYCYKADIHDYFNSIPVERFLPALRQTLADDPQTFAFLRSLLEEPCVMQDGLQIAESKGIMAGTPLSAFYANLYLRDLDAHFCDAGVPYARYSDDVILFADTEEERDRHVSWLHAYLAEQGLTLNPAKESRSAPGEAWTFLGFVCSEDRIDIAPATVRKLKQKMRRKARALQRWRKRNGLSGEKAAAAFIRIFNRKLLENSADSDLTWSYWFFSVINTADSLHGIDLYAQDCLRFLISGTRTKARYNVRYEDLKKLGYRSLVHEYYSFTTSP
ncbi:MAG: hypothetical protein K5772_05985 [Clostridia bacterium]|nr:hypothetical protein [Clostridia bacterium]